VPEVLFSFSFPLKIFLSGYCKHAALSSSEITTALPPNISLTVPAAIVIGNEGEGLSQLVRKNCDVMVSIPMKGKISSLNASAAASILLYEAVRQRIG